MMSGDKDLIVSPTYDNFRATVESRGMSVNYHSLGGPFDFRPEKLLSHEKKLNPKIAYTCNPNNPTGTADSFVAGALEAASIPQTPHLGITEL